MTTTIARRRPANDQAMQLRDLDEAAFFARYASDRFTASILGNRFRYIIKHMATKMRANAFSSVIRDMDDFCATISGPPSTGWAMPAASLTNPVHWGPVPDAVPLLLQEMGLETLRPGDVVAANDSYRTGKHLNDTSFIRPLFWDGELVGALHVTAHQQDIGSRVAGGLEMSGRTLWEDGLVLPPTLLYSAGQPVRSTFSLIAANSRTPDILLADLQVIRATLDLGEQLIMESIGRYGLDAYVGAIRYACDGAEAAMTEALHVLPDGVYSGESEIEGDGLPDSPAYRVAVRIHKRGHRLEFDFSGTSEASRSAINCSWLDVKTGVLMALKMLLDRTSPPNSGALRNVDIVLPPGVIMNPYPPAATMFYPEVVSAIMQATIQALNPTVKDDALASDSWSLHLHHAHGLTAEGKAWGGAAVAGGVKSHAWGASKAGDGDAAALLIWMNYPESGYEVKELIAPMMTLRLEAAADTGGPGYNRGGAAQMGDVYWLHGGGHHVNATRVKRPTEGARQGKPGRVGGHWLFDAETSGLDTTDWLADDRAGPLYAAATPLAGVLDPVTNELAAAGAYIQQRETRASAGSVVRSLSNGGGGWGDPLDREPERVMRDVRDGYVSLTGAERDYGVIVQGDPERYPERLIIDMAATTALRLKRRAAGA